MTSSRVYQPTGISARKRDLLPCRFWLLVLLGSGTRTYAFARKHTRTIVVQYIRQRSEEKMFETRTFTCTSTVCSTQYSALRYLHCKLKMHLQIGAIERIRVVQVFVLRRLLTKNVQFLPYHLYLIVTMKIAIALTLIASASAFAPASKPAFG